MNGPAEILKKTVASGPTTIIFYGEKEDQPIELLEGGMGREEILGKWSFFIEEKLRPYRIQANFGYLKDKLVSFINATVQPILIKGINIIPLLGNIAEGIYCEYDKRKESRSSEEDASIRRPLYRGCAYPNIEPYRGKIGEMIKRSLKTLMSSEKIVVLGKSDYIEPTSHLPWIAKKYGNPMLLEISGEKTSLTPYADFYVKMDAWEALKRILE